MFFMCSVFVLFVSLCLAERSCSPHGSKLWSQALKNHSTKPSPKLDLDQASAMGAAHAALELDVALAGTDGCFGPASFCNSASNDFGNTSPLDSTRVLATLVGAGPSRALRQDMR